MVSNRINIENQQRSSTLPWYFMYPLRTTELLGIYSTYKMTFRTTEWLGIYSTYKMTFRTTEWLGIYSTYKMTFRTTELLGIYSTYKMPKCTYWAQSPNKTEQNTQQGTNGKKEKKPWSWKSQWAHNVCLKNNIVYWYTSPHTGISIIYCITRTPWDPYLSFKAYLSI